MVRITALVPIVATHHLFFDQNLDLKNNNLSSLPSPSHQLELLPPLRYPIHTFPCLLIPQTTTFTMKEPKKKKRKEATTSYILHLMDALPFPILVDIYTLLIKECTVSGDPETAIELYTHISKSGMKPPLPFLNRILIMFVSCGLLENARHMFDKMRVRDFNSWVTMFVAYYDNAEN
ncbi:hypothetical protein LR48_Vigan04g192900 [Vigna angularis]|uniref:Pentacotripeptide-repeat region of PRORP domain-containing protein n=1 Tax=Phaseolus angularis TaxID=3914 RepID=A0A0L9UG93_PHAAN|nr:hypothetical protein LR48_Vigan04g192900 [Vigna angularis]